LLLEAEHVPKSDHFNDLRGMFCVFINGYDDNAFLQSYLNFLLGVRMIVQEAMTKDPITISPDKSVTVAAKLMRDS
jgi:hypothetical protein